MFHKGNTNSRNGRIICIYFSRHLGCNADMLFAMSLTQPYHVESLSSARLSKQGLSASRWLASVKLNVQEYSLCSSCRSLYVITLIRRTPLPSHFFRRQITADSPTPAFESLPSSRHGHAGRRVGLDAGYVDHDVSFRRHRRYILGYVSKILAYLVIIVNISLLIS